MKAPIVSIDVLTIALIVGGAALVVVGVVILLYFTIFARMRYKKQVRELNRRFEYLHALLFGQDSQYIKRIEIISLTNLLYVTPHMTFNKRFKDVRDKSDSSAQTAINNLKDLISDHDYKSLKEALPIAKATIDHYDEEVNALNKDLLVVIKPEEECRQESLLLKEELRKIKQDYYVKQADLTLVATSFDRSFGLLDTKFNEFESFVESAQYDEAKDLLPFISDIIKQLGRILKDMPNLCITIQSIIPDKMASLQNRYEDMKRADFPLHHLCVMGGIEEMNLALKNITKRVQTFDLRGVNEELDGILARIEEFLSSFDRERDARLIFEKECDSIYSDDTGIEKKYIRLCNALPDVKHIYVIPAEQQAKIDNIKNLINKSGATKRSLDTFIHCGTKQPYTLLVEKMHALRDESIAASQAIDDFDRYLLSLKTDSEAAVEAVKNYFKALKKAEADLREINIPAIDDKYLTNIDSLYGVIDDLHKTLHALPIDVEKANSLVGILHSEGDALIKGVNADYEACHLADSAIIYANRSRSKMKEIDVCLLQAESLYFNGELKRAYDEAVACVKAYRGE